MSHLQRVFLLWAAGNTELLEIDTERLVGVFGVPKSKHIFVERMAVRASAANRTITFHIDPEPQDIIRSANDEKWNRNMWICTVASTGTTEFSMGFHLKNQILILNDNNTNTWHLGFDYRIVDGPMDWRSELVEVMPDIRGLGEPQISAGQPYFKAGSRRVVGRPDGDVP